MFKRFLAASALATALIAPAMAQDASKDLTPDEAKTVSIAKAFTACAKNETPAVAEKAMTQIVAEQIARFEDPDRDSQAAESGLQPSKIIDKQKFEAAIRGNPQAQMVAMQQAQEAVMEICVKQTGIADFEKFSGQVSEIQDAKPDAFLKAYQP